jgi:hypothetical protein
LPGPVADNEPKVRGAITQIHQQVADLLYCPSPVRIRGHAEEVQVAAADLHDEQAVQAAEGHRAVDVEEVGGERRGCLRVQELPPRRVGVPLGRRGIFSALRTLRTVDALPRWPSLSSSPWIRWYPRPRRLLAPHSVELDSENETLQAQIAEA